MVKALGHVESYMDDSGSHDGAPVCIIAGYFGGHRRWLRFEEQWKGVLESYGVKEFHSKIFWGRDSDGRRLKGYKEWSDSKAERYIDELLTIIEQNDRIFPFSVGVQNEEWKKQSLENKRILSGASRKYPTGKPSKSMFLAFQRCVLRVASYCNPGIRVHYFFDDDHGKNSAWAYICYSNLKNHFRKLDYATYSSMGELTMADGVYAVPFVGGITTPYCDQFYWGFAVAITTSYAYEAYAIG
jgi:hypothetical protein